MSFQNSSMIKIISYAENLKRFLIKYKTVGFSEFVLQA